MCCNSLLNICMQWCHILQVGSGASSFSLSHLWCSVCLVLLAHHKLLIGEKTLVLGRQGKNHYTSWRGCVFMGNRAVSNYTKNCIYLGKTCKLWRLGVKSEENKRIREKTPRHIQPATKNSDSEAIHHSKESQNCQPWLTEGSIHSYNSRVAKGLP